MEKYLELLTIKEVSKILKIPTGTIYVKMHRGVFPIPYIKVGRLIRFFKSDFENYLESQPKIGSNEITP